MDTENPLHIKIGVVATLTDDEEIDYREIQMPRNAEVRKLLDNLKAEYPGAHIFMNNQLSELQCDDIIDDIYEEGDVLTAFRTEMNMDRTVSQIKNASDAIVVLVNKKRQPIFIKSGNTESYKWKALDFDPIITVFRKKYQLVNGQEVEEIREDEVVYIGRQYQIPNRSKGDVYKLQITKTGVRKTDNAGHSEDLREVPGHPKEILEGAFFRPTAKKLKLNFQNNTGAPVHVITGSKWLFDAYDIPVDGEQLIKISKNKFGLVQQTAEKPGNREMTATMFEVLSLGEIQISKTKSSFTAKLVRRGQSEEELRNCGAKMFKDKENWTKKDILMFAMKGVSIGLSLVGVGLGGAALAENLMDTVETVPLETMEMDTPDIGNNDDGISEPPVEEGLESTLPPSCK